jgi:hypothetical protein
VLLAKNVSSAVDMVEAEKFRGRLSATGTLSPIVGKNRLPQFLPSYFLVFGDDLRIFFSIILTLFLYMFFVDFVPLFVSFAVTLIATPPWTVVILTKERLPMFATYSQLFFGHNQVLHKECKKTMKVMGAKPEIALAPLY